MKNLLHFFTILLFTSKLYSQDTIVSNNGLIVSGTIIESDSLFISYKSLDNLESEVNLVKKSTVILIKYQDGRLEQFYKNDTLLTKNGDQIIAKVLEIDAEMLSYFAYDGNIREVKIVPLSSLFMYKLADGTKAVISDKKNDLINYAALGESDAKLYYRTNKSGLTGQVVLGALFWTGLGSIAGLILPVIPPSNLHSPLNPNDEFLNTNEDYKRAYNKVASNKKLKSYYAGFGAGLALPIAYFIYVIYYW